MQKKSFVTRMVELGQRKPYLRYPVLAIIACTLACYHFGRFLYSLRKKAVFAATVCGVVLICGHTHLRANAGNEPAVYTGGNTEAQTQAEAAISDMEPESVPEIQTSPWTEKEIVNVAGNTETEPMMTEALAEPESTEVAAEAESTETAEAESTSLTEAESTVPAEAETTLDEAESEEAETSESVEAESEGEESEEDEDTPETEDVSEETEAAEDEDAEPESTEAETESEGAEAVTELDAVAENMFDWYLLLVNRSHPLTKEYRPETRSIGSGIKVDVRIYEPLRAMLNAGNSQGCSLLVCSGYRSYERQVELYEEDVAKYQRRGYSYERACELTEETLLPPGTSEHQAGLAVDIVATTRQVLDSGFENTAEGKWLAAHAHEYGFILRYPKDKVEITEINYEPWHFRYVGVEAATEIHELGCCLEEYIEILKDRAAQEMENPDTITEETTAAETIISETETQVTVESVQE